MQREAEAAQKRESTEEAQRQETLAELQRLIVEAVTSISSTAGVDGITYLIRYEYDVKLRRLI